MVCLELQLQFTQGTGGPPKDWQGGPNTGKVAGPLVM